MPPTKLMAKTASLPRNPRVSTGHSGRGRGQAPGISRIRDTDATNKNIGCEPATTPTENTPVEQPNRADVSTEIGQITDPRATAMDVDPSTDGFLPVKTNPTSQDKLATAIQKKRYQMGVQITRTVSGDSRICTEDLTLLFRLLSNIDSSAFIIPASKDVNQAKPISKMTQLLRMDFNGYLDIQTTTWGPTSANTKRTTLSFWIASDTITPGLKELRDNLPLKEFLFSGSCRLNPTTLTESRTKVVAYFEGKDPKHTHRDTMAERISAHLNSFSKGDNPIPVKVIPIMEKDQSMLAVVVGSRDQRMVETILEKHKFPDLELIMQSWKRKQPKEFQQRLTNHQLVVNNSTAFKLEGMDPKVVPQFAEHLRKADCSSTIVDICPTGHSHKTGVVYVQFFRGYENSTIQAIDKALQECPNQDLAFSTPASVTNRTTFGEARTVYTTTSNEQASTPPVPTSKWTTFFAKTTKGMPIPFQLQVPPAITTTLPKPFRRPGPKPFGKAPPQDTQETPDINSSDDESTLTERTKNTGSQQSKKTVREEALERENERLSLTLESMEERHTNLHNQMKEMEDNHNKAIQALTEMVQRLQQSVENTQAESPVRKPSSSKRPNNNSTPEPKQGGSKWQETIQNTLMTDIADDTTESPSTKSTTPPPEVGNQE